MSGFRCYIFKENTEKSDMQEARAPLAFWGSVGRSRERTLKSPEELWWSCVSCCGWCITAPWMSMSMLGYPWLDCYQLVTYNNWRQHVRPVVEAVSALWDTSERVYLISAGCSGVFMYPPQGDLFTWTKSILSRSFLQYKLLCRYWSRDGP